MRLPYVTILCLLSVAGAIGSAATPEVALPALFFSNPPGSNSLYFARTPGLRALFDRDGVVFRAHETQVRIRYRHANPNTSIEPAEPSDARINLFLGARDGWRREIPTYQALLYRDLYLGIDLKYRGQGDGIKSEFIIQPGADPAQIRMQYDDAERISIDRDGNLIVRAQGSDWRDKSPEIFQQSGGTKVAVNGRYRLLDSKTVGFQIDSFDPALPLVIDPLVTFSTYLGGTGESAITGVAIDSVGNLYATGWTEALDFPIAGAFQGANRGGVDAFVVKLNPSGSALLYATYIGGRGDDRGAGIAVDAAGEAYVTGSTASTNFPLVSSFRPSLGGGQDAFVLKLNASGSSLLFSTYFGGGNVDSGTAIALDGFANAYVCGDTLSTDFPLHNAVQPALGGGADAFLAKLTSAGSLTFATYFGGSGDEHCGGVTADSNGNAYIAGGTYSANFPTAVPIQASNGGGQDAFVAKIDASGMRVVYSTYLGGPPGASPPGMFEQANAIAVDAAGAAYVTGVTNSGGFPVTHGSLRNAYNGTQDAFAVKINPVGSALTYGTYLGGSGLNWASAVTCDANGNAFIAGYTSSVDFPTVDPIQAALGGYFDAFASGLDTKGDALLFSTYYGGSGAESVSALATDSAGSVFFGGGTNSVDFPAQNALQSHNSGGSTGWLARLYQNLELLVLAANPPGGGTISATPSAPGGYYAPGTSVQIAASPAAGYRFTGFSGALSGTTNPQSLIMSGPTAVTATFALTCTFMLATAGASVSSAAGAGSVGLTASNPGCAYAASSNAGWLTITGGGAGSGGATVSYSFTANNSPSARVGMLTIAGLTYSITQSSAGVSMTLSQNKLNFAFSGGVITDPQTVSATFSGGAKLSWTATSNQPNVTVSPASGTGLGFLQITASAGPSAVVTIAAPGATNSPQQIQVNIASVTPGVPWGSFDTPVNNTTGVMGELPVTGWALDAVEITKVDIWREMGGGLAYIGDAEFVAGTRPDVEGDFPNAPLNYRAGWGFMILTNELPNIGAGLGNGTYKLHAIAHNRTGATQDLGTKTITVDNAHASNPFGTIDTPGQGQVQTGAIVNFGWVVTQQPYIVPFDGSTIWVIVDGQYLGHPAYNNYRVDIATLFPGLNNSNGAVGFFYIDTTALTNGIHSIAWGLTDNASRSAGIGSRYFYVFN